MRACSVIEKGCLQLEKKWHMEERISRVIHIVCAPELRLVLVPLNYMCVPLGNLSHTEYVILVEIT